MHESQAWALECRLDGIAERFRCGRHEAPELRGSPMLTGKREWRRVPREVRVGAIEEALGLLQPGMAVIAVIVEKAALAGHDPLPFAFQMLCRKFDVFLHGCKPSGPRQEGLIILDEMSCARALQGLARGFRRVRHEWGIVEHLAEVPLFLDSEASRLVQLADLVSYGMFLKYERGDERFSRRIEARMEGVETAEYVAAPCLR